MQVELSPAGVQPIAKAGKQMVVPGPLLIGMVIVLEAPILRGVQVRGGRQAQIEKQCDG